MLSVVRSSYHQSHIVTLYCTPYVKDQVKHKSRACFSVTSTISFYTLNLSKFVLPHARNHIQPYRSNFLYFHAAGQATLTIPGTNITIPLGTTNTANVLAQQQQQQQHQQQQQQQQQVAAANAAVANQQQNSAQSQQVQSQTQQQQHTQHAQTQVQVQTQQPATQQIQHVQPATITIPGTNIQVPTSAVTAQSILPNNITTIKLEGGNSDCRSPSVCFPYNSLMFLSHFGCLLSYSNHFACSYIVIFFFGGGSADPFSISLTLNSLLLQVKTCKFDQLVLCRRLSSFLCSKPYRYRYRSLPVMAKPSTRPSTCQFKQSVRL